MEAYMRINSGPSLLNKSAKVSSHDAIEQTKERPIENASSRNSASDVPSRWLISREDLLALAADLKNGRIDRDEASSRFIERVVDNSLDNKLSDKDKEVLTQAINNFFADDQDFVRSLEKNLTNLT
jgi:hypothetical protein